MAKVIVTRTSAEYAAAIERLKKEDLAAKKKADRAQARAEKAARNRTLPSAPTTASESHPRSFPLSKKKKRKAKQSKGKNKNKKGKKRSVWTISGGAVDSNRRRH